MLLYSPAYVVLVALFLTLLSLQVLVLRLKYSIPTGEKGSEVLARAVRAQATTVEYSVVFIPLLICVELMGASNNWIAATSVVFLLGRLIHSSAILTIGGMHPSMLVGAALSHTASVALMVKLGMTLLSIG